MASEKMKKCVEHLKAVRMPLAVPQELPTDALIDDYEIRLGVKFNDDYRYFLKEAGDSLYRGMGIFRMTADGSHPHELEVELNAARSVGVPTSLVPISEANGDYFCFNDADQVVFWSHDGDTDEKWPDFASWVKDVWIDGN